jgi:hypothetical protein
MRFFNTKTVQFQFEGTAPEDGAIPVYKEEEQFYMKTPEEEGQFYVIYEKVTGIDPKDTFIKIRNNIDKSKAIIRDYRYYPGDTTENFIDRYLQELQK